MKWNIVNQPICSGHAVRKEMPIPLAIPIALAAASAASSIWGGSKAAKAAKEQERMLAAEKARLQSERLRRLNEDYLDTNAGQNLIRVAKEAAETNWKKAEAAAAVNGATDAAAQMAKDAGNKMVGDAIANIAAQDTNRKDTIDQTYQSNISQLTQQQMNAERERAAGIQQAAGGMSSALGSAAIATFGGTKLGQSWFGGGEQAAKEGAKAVTDTAASTVKDTSFLTDPQQLFSHPYRVPFNLDWQTALRGLNMFSRTH